MRRIYLAAVLAAAVMLAFPMSAFSDGTETLGVPSVSVAAGTGVTVAGAGTQAFPNVDRSFGVNVPAGATVKQVLLYWEGHWTDHAPHLSNTPQIDGDNAISINGTPVAGTKIGGSTAFFAQAAGAFDGTEKFVSYRADITALNLVAAGANTLTVGNMSFASNFPTGFPFNQGNDGAGVVVIYDDGTNASVVGLRDGNDLAYANFASPLDTTVPQTFSFAASNVARTGSLATLVGSVAGPDLGGLRGTILRGTFDGGATFEVHNPWQSTSGAEFDAVTLPVTIPAGATQMTVQALSAGGVLPASFAWIGATLSLQNPPPPPLAALGDFVWHDLNKDGIQDAGEPGIAGVTVELSNCAGTVSATTTTNASGLYLFSGLTPGGYSVRFVLPSGYVFSPQDQGADDAKDSDANTTTGMTGCYTLARGQTNLTVDAGLFQPPRPGATLLIIDEDSIDNGIHFNPYGGLITPSGPKFFSCWT